MKIKTSQVLTNFKGETLKNGNKDFTVGDAISEILVADTAGGKYKMYILAEKCAISKEVEVDEADFKLIKTTIENHKPGYTALITGQLLKILEGKEIK